MPRAHKDISRPPRNQGTQESGTWKRGSFSASSDKWRLRRKTDARGWSVKHHEAQGPSAIRYGWGVNWEGGIGASRDERGWGLDHVSLRSQAEGPAIYPVKDRKLLKLGVLD